jgi:methylenetetrahydrofolate reductase (NADPH)
MHDAFARARDAEARTLLATALGAEQCDDLIANGVEHLHFYTLNKSGLIGNICRALGIEPEPLTMAADCG